MDSPGLICARLLREGTIPRDEIPELDIPEVRQQVEQRLASVGLILATSAYSSHVGLRISPELTAERQFDAASNLGLKADACALLVALWARLVLQKRAAVDSGSVPGQSSLFPQDRLDSAKDYSPQVRFETLAREFGPTIGSRSHLQRLVSQLRRLGFVRVLPGHIIEPGPLLELAVDGERMVAFIRRGVLAQMAETKAPEADAETTPTLEDQVESAIRSRKEGARIGEIEEATGERREKIRLVLRDLEQM